MGLPRNRTHPLLAAALATAALLLLPLAGPADGRPARVKTDTITISVADVNPAVLPTDTKEHPLAVTLEITNRGDQPLSGLSIEAERGEPINSQGQLDQALKHVTTPTGSIVGVEPTSPVTVDLAPGATQEVVFRSTTSTLQTKGLCNCTNPDQPALIYPIYFTAHLKGAGGVDQSLGLARTFVSAFQHPPTSPVRVSWVWPLVDQPHLLDDTPIGTSGPVFTDDFLAASVGTGGRLDKALQVAEQVAADPAKAPLTLLVDPELLDELQLMASGPYQVQTGKASFTTGSGRDVAAAWLGRLRGLLDSAPQFHLQFTPYADPDVESLQAAGLSWSAELPPAMQERVGQALGRSLPTTTFAWPAAGALGRATMSALVRQGVGTVLLNGSAITPKPAATAIHPGLARLSIDGRDVAVGVLDQALQKYVQQAVTSGKAGAAALPLLTAELTIRSIAEPTADHVAVLAPPRWVDADVANAVRTIVYTSGTDGTTSDDTDAGRTSFATRSISLDTAVGGQLLPNGRSHLASVPAGARTLPAGNVAVIERASQDLPALTSVFTPLKPATIDPQAQAVLAELPLEEQRMASAAWGRPGFGASAGAFGQRLLDRLDQLTHAITIVAKAGSSYTLASDNSPFPLTVRNTLPWPVRVQAEVRTADGLRGFGATPKTETVGANQKASFKLATKVDRAGRIRVVASLYTPDGSHQIGDSVELTVRSTALGTVGVIITVGAGAVLVLALLVRFGRRLRHRWSGNAGGHRHWDPDAPDAAQTFAEAMREREPAEPAP